MTATNIITKSTLMSNSHAGVYDTINQRSNVPDPKNPNDLIRTFVYKNDPWSKGNYDGYPYIIVRFPQIDYGDNSDKSVDGNHKNISWACEITVRTKIGDGINNPDGSNKGVTDMNSIIDDLHETFNSKAIKDALRALKMYNFNLSTQSNDEITDSNDKHIFITELNLDFDTRLKVSV